MFHIYFHLNLTLFPISIKSLFLLGKGGKNNFISSSVNNFESMLNERGNKSDRNQYEGKRKIILKKINRSRKSLFRNNSEILNNNYNSIKLSKKFD